MAIKELSKKIFKDNRGSILPLIAIILIIFILLGAYEIGSTFVFRDRAKLS